MARLFIYNPTCDMAVENGTLSYMPPRQLQLFEAEIAPLMAFLGNANDLLLGQQAPLAYLEFWAKTPWLMPRFISADQLTKTAPSEIKEVRPWGWSQLISKLAGQINPTPNYLPDFSNDTTRRFFSRLTSVKLIEHLQQIELPQQVEIPRLPKIIRHYKEVEDFLKGQQQGIVLKTLWSSSGRGTCFIRRSSDLAANTPWINGWLKKHQCLIAEPIYPKVQDASMQFIIHPDQSYQFLGINYFDADEQGRFAREYLHSPAVIQQQTLHFNDAIPSLAQALQQAMRREEIEKHYTGPVGIDVLFYTSPQGQLKLYPLVEANLRCNMGLVNWRLKEKISPGSTGTWQIQRFRKGEASHLFDTHSARHPLQIKNGKISSGFIPLTPLTSETTFGAWGIIQG